MAALSEDAPPEQKALLAAELAVLEESSGRFPWQDNLPDPIRLSLEPFRERLEAGYNPLTNQFELARNSRRGRFSFTTE